MFYVVFCLFYEHVACTNLVCSVFVCEGVIQLKAQYESRISHLEKENASVLAEKQQEKERMMKDMETLNQRVNQLQRQLDKQQVM